MTKTNTHGMDSAIKIINAAFAKNGQPTYRPRLGTMQFNLIQQTYHDTRRNLLCEMMPEFAIENGEVGMDGIRPLRDLGDGRFVYDVEDVIDFSDEFINEFISKLAKKLVIFGNSLGRSRRSRMW